MKCATRVLRMNRNVPAALAGLLLGIAAISCAADNDLQKEFALLTAKGATHRQVRAYQGAFPGKQLDYLVTMEFPAAAIDSTREREIQDLGWKLCTARDSGWVSVPDNSVKTTPQCAYALNKSFIRGTQLMRITMEYRAKLEKKWHCDPKPDNTRQLVIVSVYNYPNRENMRLDELGLSCPK